MITRQTKSGFDLIQTTRCYIMSPHDDNIMYFASFENQFPAVKLYTTHFLPPPLNNLFYCCVGGWCYSDSWWSCQHASTLSWSLAAWPSRTCHCAWPSPWSLRFQARPGSLHSATFCIKHKQLLANKATKWSLSANLTLETSNMSMELDKPRPEGSCCIVTMHRPQWNNLFD